MIGTLPVATRSVDEQGRRKNTAAVAISDGRFLNTIIDFVIVAFFIFLVIKQVNHFTEKPEPPPSRRRNPAHTARPTSRSRPPAARTARRI